MGILDLFTMIGGGAWLTKEAIRETADRGEEKHKCNLAKRYMEENTDIELEQEFARLLDRDYASHDEIWTRLEEFKRDNPVWCEQHSQKPYYCTYTQKFVEPSLNWYHVGRKRQIVGNGVNRGTVLSMLMATCGKRTVDAARHDTFDLY